MSREIKFRMYDIGQKRMREWDEIKTSLMQVLEFASAPIMQFTGLRDKNGVEIYEADIVHYAYHPGKGYWNHDVTGVISWESTGFHFAGIARGYHGWLVSLPGGGADEKPNELFEVIGNIHQHPDLLEAK